MVFFIFTRSAEGPCQMLSLLLIIHNCSEYWNYSARYNKMNLCFKCSSICFVALVFLCFSFIYIISNIVRSVCSAFCFCSSETSFDFVVVCFSLRSPRDWQSDRAQCLYGQSWKNRRQNTFCRERKKNDKRINKLGLATRALVGQDTLSARVQPSTSLFAVMHFTSKKKSCLKANLLMVSCQVSLSNIFFFYLEVRGSEVDYYTVLPWLGGNCPGGVRGSSAR